MFNDNTTAEQAQVCGEASFGDFSAIADLGRNGTVDLLATADDGIALLFVSPSGQLDPADASAQFGLDDVHEVAAADLDHDVWLEIVTIGGGDGQAKLRAYAGSSSGFAGTYQPSSAASTVSWSGGPSAPSRLFLAELTGDGPTDVVALDADGSDDRGRLWLFEGPLPTALDSSDNDVALVGEPTASFGRSATSGDANGDGYADLIVSAFTSSANGTNAGAVYVFHGPLSGGSPTPDATFLGAESALAGSSICSADFDGDDRDDLLVGSPGVNSFQGTATVVYGPVAGTQELSDIDGLVVNGSANQSVGVQVGCPGDLSGNGFDDAVIGGPSFFLPEVVPLAALLEGQGQ